MIRKRVCCALLAASMLMTGCAGAGAGNSATKKETTKITIWHYYTGEQQDAFTKLVEEFNETKGKELGIIVDESSQGSISDLTKSILASANKEAGADKLPNIFSSYADTAYDLNEQGLIADIRSYFTDEEIEEYVDGYIEEGDLNGDGGLEILPIAKATEIFLLNKTDWDRFAQDTGADLSQLDTIEGVTQTAEDYYQWTDGLTDTPDDGKAFFGRDAMANYMIIGTRQLGDDIMTEDDKGNVTINFPEKTARKLWDNFYVPYIKGYFSAMGKFRSDDMKTGNALSFVGSSSGSSFFPDKVVLDDQKSYPIEVQVRKAPKFAGGEDYAVQQGAGMVVTKESEEEVKASVEFLKWFTEAENNIDFTVGAGYLPVKKEANQMDEIENIGELSENNKATLEVAFDTVQTSEMYSLKGQTGDARKILETSLLDAAKSDREDIKAKIESGTSREDAIALYDTDERFTTWYQGLLKTLGEAVK